MSPVWSSLTGTSSGNRPRPWLPLDVEDVGGLEDLHRQCPITHLVEQHGHPVLLDVGHQAGAEGAVPNPTLGGDATGRLAGPYGRCRCASAAAVVTVAARLRQDLPEVREQEVGPAPVGLGVPAHHLDP